MNTLVDRLIAQSSTVHSAAYHTMKEAATRIEQLEAALSRLSKSAGTVMRYLEQDGPRVVPHLMDSDDNPGQRCREDIAQALSVLASLRKPGQC